MSDYYRLENFVRLNLVRSGYVWLGQENWS